jgi:DNA-binding NarL/FixJ family response regulator
MSNPIRVLIVDDHTLFREGVTALLSTALNIEVVGEAATGNEAVDKAIALTPDVILMDIQMPDGSGIDATQRIFQSLPNVSVIMLTMLEDNDSLFAAMRAGARGYILKGADKVEVLKTIRAVADGEALFGPAVAKRLTAFFQHLGKTSLRTAPDLVFPELTEREREILELVAQRLTNPEISDRLAISGKTVSNHISSIFNKLQIVDRTQAIIRAREAGLGKLS